MKKTTILFFLIFCCFLKAQNHRFIYEYRYVPDSTKTDSVLTENMRLTLFADHSEFLSELKARRDSAVQKSSQAGKREIGSNLKTGNIRGMVWKSSDGTKKYTHEFIGIESYKILDERKLNWELKEETKKIQNYNCQKAVVNFGKRTWTAWFTTELPFQEGPHVFGKLPGLIVSIEDSGKQHSFQLVANYKTDAHSFVLKQLKLLKTYEVSVKQFNKKWNEFRKNPIGMHEQFTLMNPSISGFQIFDENKKEIDLNEYRKKERERAKKNVKNHNNFLDLELYQ